MVNCDSANFDSAHYDLGSAHCDLAEHSSAQYDLVVLNCDLVASYDSANYK